MSKLKSLEESFGGRHFDREIIILCVRWYLRYKLSLRDLVSPHRRSEPPVSPGESRSLNQERL
jgi:transposase-like protein